MELSPLEIKSQKFSKRLKGYDIIEVEDFLELISKDLEKLYGDFYNLKEELVKKNQEIKEYKEKDKTIREAIIMVQSMGDDIRGAAKKEAEVIRNNAIVEAKKIVDDAYKKYSEIYANVNDLLNKRLLIIHSIKSLLTTNIDLIIQEESKKIELFAPAEDKKFVESIADVLKKTGIEEIGTEKAGKIEEKNGEKEPPVDKEKEKETAAKSNNKDKDKKDYFDNLLGDVNKFYF